VRTLCTLVLAGLLLVVPATAANAQVWPREFQGHHQVLPVYVVPWLGLEDLPTLSDRGAIGLMVTAAGPRTSASQAFGSLVRGVLHNSRLGDKVTGPVLIRVRKRNALPTGGPVIVIGLPPTSSVPNVQRYPIALFNRHCHGILVSSLTRVPGLVSIADVARTALASKDALTCRSGGNPVQQLDELESRIDVARGSTMAGTVIVLVMAFLLALLRPRWIVPAVATALVANLALGFLDAGDATMTLVVLTLLSLAGGLAGERLSLERRPGLLGAGLVGILLAYLAAMVVAPWSLSLAPLGPELTARFFGVSNLLETLLLLPALLAAVLVGRRLGPLGFVAVALIALAVVAENRLGADGGGAIVLGVAYAVLGVRLAGGRWRLVVPAVVFAGLVVLGLANLDAASSGPDHLRGALTGGLPALGQVLLHRVPLSYARMLDQWYLVFPACALGLLAVRAIRAQHDPGRRALDIAFLAGIVASLALNDSPGPVTLGGLAVFLALEPDALRRELAPLARRLPRLAPQPEPVPVTAGSRRRR
jgi:hypothetical protein